MRQIRLRAWNKKAEYFAPIEDDADFALGFDSKGGIFMVNNGTPEPDEWEFQQFTGLRDKNGREIYEGDVVKVYDPHGEVWSSNGAEVIFSTDYVGGWVVSNGKNNLNLGTRQNHLEVIGNIYENPELLS